jgi:hypothetical protein
MASNRFRQIKKHRSIGTQYMTHQHEPGGHGCWGNDSGTSQHPRSCGWAPPIGGQHTGCGIEDTYLPRRCLHKKLLAAFNRDARYLK